MDPKKNKLWIKMKKISRRKFNVNKLDFNRIKDGKFVEDKKELKIIGEEIFDNFNLKDLEKINLFIDICAAPGVYSKIKKDDKKDDTLLKKIQNSIKKLENDDKKDDNTIKKIQKSIKKLESSSKKSSSAAKKDDKKDDAKIKKLEQTIKKLESDDKKDDAEIKKIKQSIKKLESDNKKSKSNTKKDDKKDDVFL